MKKIKRQWQARFSNWIGGKKRGVRCSGVRRRGRGDWIHPGNAPKEVIEYLSINDKSDDRGTGGKSLSWCNSDYPTIQQMAKEIDQSLKARVVGSFLVIDFTVEEVREERLLPIHSAVRRLGKDVGEDTLGGIYRRLYKHSTCGVSVGFWIKGLPGGHAARPVYGGKPQADEPIWVYCDSLYKLPSLAEMFAGGMEIVGIDIAGYVEGWDGELQPRVLTATRNHSVSADDIWMAVNAADEEAGEVWEETHGCEQCGPEDGAGYRHINPNCKSCEGQGTIL